MKNSYVIQVFALLAWKPECFAKPTCEAGWNEFNGHCYLFHTAAEPLTPSTWSNSRFQCQLLGGDLLSIENEAEKSFIASIFTKNKNIRKYHYWIGLNDINSENNWEWSDGTPFNVSNWRTYPNNHHGDEDCVEISLEGKWNDDNCDKELAFVCEKVKGKINPTPKIPPYPNITDRPTTCEAGWIPWRTSCYGIIRGILYSWKDAHADCLRRFADLVVIDDMNENDFLANEISRSLSEGYWIGLSDQNSPNRFSWVDETPLNDSITNWGTNEPSNSFGSEDCVEIYAQWKPGKWNDNHCNSLKNYICEKNSGTHNCPDGWESFNGYCYQINVHPNQKLSFNDARTMCLSFNQPWKEIIDIAGADLVSITSQDEHDFVDKMFKSYRIPTYDKFYWIGLSKNSSEGFHWTDNSILKYQDWVNAIPGVNNSCVKSALRATYANSWKAASCSEKHYYVCKVKRGKDRCYDPIGIQDYRIPDSSFTASSQLFLTTPPSAARLYLKNQKGLDGAWCAANNTRNPWLQIDFGKPEKLTYISYQGKANSDAFVTSFYLKYSMDGISWDTYGDIPPNLYYKFKTSHHRRRKKENVVTLPLNSPLKARYIRIYPFRKECHVGCCMRVEFYGCPEDESTQECGVGWRKDEASKNCYQFSTTKTTWDSAERICMTQGGHLASITSKKERDYINQQVKPLSGGKPYYWIGLNDLEEEFVYSWSDKSPIRVPHSISNRGGNCVAVKASDGTWSTEDCTTILNFICKKSYVSPYVPKKPMNGNLQTAADYFWKMDAIPKDSKIAGSVPAKAIGSFTMKDFVFHHSYLTFDGATSYLNVTSSVISKCVSHPGSCPYGISVRFDFKYTGSLSGDQRFILDTLGKAQDTVGFHVYIRNGRINVYLRDSDYNYFTSDTLVADSFNHFAFTWSPHTGLKTYVNGVKKSNNYGSSNIRVLKKEDITDLIIGRSASDTTSFTQMEMGSLAIFERVLSFELLYDWYVAEFGQCRLNQLEFGSFCYEFHAEQKYWDTALKDCVVRGGNLASIHSSVEQAFITLKTGKLGLNRELWVGLSRRKALGFEWSDGTSVSYTKWDRNEPNSRDLASCAHTVKEDFKEKNSNSNTGSWKDAYCYSSNGFICKYRKTIDQEKLQEKEPLEHNLTFSNGFNYETFGCKFPKQIRIRNVTYGSKTENPPCFFGESVLKLIVLKHCDNYSCWIRSSDYYFGNPCPGKSGVKKEASIVYSCVDDTTPKPGCSGYGYELSDDRTACYKLHLDEAIVNDARNKCLSEGGDLTSITSETEQLYLTTMLVQLYAPRDIWIGMAYNDFTQTYTWMDGMPVIYTTWYNKNPDPRVGRFVKVGVGNGQTSMYWYPAAQSEKHPFFCKKYPHNKGKPAVVTTEAPERMDCPDKWMSHKNYCYFYNNEIMSFVDANEYCQKKQPGANLASIMDGGENNILRQFFYNTSAVNSKFAWVGLTNEALNSGFRWADGEPLKYINWLSNRPYTGNRHFCAGININGFWEDTPCYVKYSSICKIFKGKLPPSTTASPFTHVTPTQNVPCPSSDGWLYNNGNCYYFSKLYFEQKNYHDATIECGKMKSTIVSIRDANENSFIQQERKKQFSRSDRVMIGLADFSTTSGWKWPDGEIVKFTNFKEGEPSNTNGMESCVEIREDGKWNDFSCNIKMYYICKLHKDNIPAIKIVPRDKGYCEDGWKLYGQNCYLFKHGGDNELRHEDAQQFCRAQKSELASIHSSYENAYILSQLYDVYSTLYIGLDDNIKERTFLWSDQSSVDYVNWYTWQPSSYDDEDCVEMYPYHNYDGKWNDINCQKKNAFVCKKDSTQGKGTMVRPATTPNPATSCPSGYIKYQSSCYFFSDEKKTWNEADAECKSMSQGQLVSIHSHFEQAYVFSHFVEHDNVTWIGLSRDKSQTDFNWSDKSDVEYLYWEDRNVPKMSNTSRQCVSQVYSIKLNGQWVASDCNEKHSFVCKISKESEIENEEGFIGNCSDGWEKFKGKCYKYFKERHEKKSWSAARQKCVSYGGDLVTIDSFALQRKIMLLTRGDRTTNPVWIGLNDREKEHVFSWSSGVPFSGDSFSNWEYNEPNDNSGIENCVEFQSNTGFWNDYNCQRTFGFICEHSLECRDPLGFENGLLPDKSFVATSFYGEYYPKYARINARLNAVLDNKHMAWCTNETSTPQTLTVNLGQYQHITRISTQGLDSGTFLRSYVISYQLQYSKDGKNWQDYIARISDGSFSKNLPGNMDSVKIEGNAVDIRAQYLRVTPVLFKSNRICLRLEMYGCSSVCLKPLTAMATAYSDSVYLPHPPTPLYSEPLSINDRPLNYVLNFASRIKVTRIEVRGSEKTFEYNLLYNNKHGELVLFNTDDRKVKVFRTSVEVYDLGVPILTHKVTIQSKSAISQNVRIKMFGCVKDCDTPLGLSTDSIPDYLLKAKSQENNFSVSQARLNTGEYNHNSWCALNNDKNQYLQIDLKKTAQVTGIATQGFFGDVEKYVTHYYVQWSVDGDLWKQIPNEFTGNIDGASVVKVKFDIPINTRYLRILPTKHKSGICMRVELFGCLFRLDNAKNDGKKNGRQFGGSSGLSTGGKIGLLMFFLIVVIVIVVVAAVYYLRRRYWGFDVPHKSFANPVHIDMTSDAINLMNSAE